MANIFYTVASLATAFAQALNQLVNGFNGTSDVGDIIAYAQITTLPGALTSVAGATGVLTGAYSYQVTYVTGLVDGSGVLHVHGETTVGTASTTVNVTTQNINLSAIPIGPTGVIARNVYRTKAGGSIYYLDFQISDNTATSWPDTTADTSLVTLVPATNTTGSRFVGNGSGLINLLVPVTSVNSKTGDVVLTPSDIGADVAGSATAAQTTAEAYTDAKFPVSTSELAAGAATDAVIGNRTGDPALATPSSTGTLAQLFGWIMGRIKAITGTTNWYDAPAATLASLNSATGNVSTLNTTSKVLTGAVNEHLADTASHGTVLRQALINGNFAINQRVASAGVVLLPGQYGHDRWKAGAGGCNYTFATSNNVTTITISAGSLQQVIEGINLFTGTYALSWVGTAQGRIGAGSFGASGITGSAAGGTNLTVEFNAGTLSKTQFNYGSIVLPFTPKSFTQELQDCMRYFWKTFPLATAQVQACGSTNNAISYTVIVASTQHSIRIQFPTRMRIAPTLTFYNPINANAKWYNKNLSADSGIAGTPWGIADDHGFTVIDPGVAGNAVVNTIFVHVSADAEL